MQTKKKKPFPSRGKGRNGSSKIKEEDPSMSKDFKRTKDCANDPAWYTRNPQSAKDVASLSFNNAAGAPIPLGGDNPYGDTLIGSTQAYVPGIMTIVTAPVPGVSINATSPINIAAKNLYSFVRHQNSGHTNYDSPDLMLYVLAMDSIYSILMHIQRAIGAATVYSQVNRYIGDTLLQAMGINPESLRISLADSRARLNMLLLKASVFAIPKTMTLFNRHTWMYNTIFQDSPVAKSQFYLYKPGFAYKYTETSGTPGYLEPYPVGLVVTTDSNGVQSMSHTNWNINQFFTLAETLLGALIESEDINIMSGDILKAYGRENLFSLAPITEAYVTIPFYSEEVLDQIHNTIFTGTRIRNVSDLSGDTKIVNTASLRITQVVSVAGNYLVCRPQFADAAHISTSKFLDMADNTPTPERVLVATRNMVAGSTSSITGNVGNFNHTITTLNSAGSDICMGAIIFTNSSGGTPALTPVYISDSSLAQTATLAYSITRFKSAPLGYSGVYDDDNVFTPYLPRFELGNYTVLNTNDISKIHESALLSMLGVPV